MSGLVPLAAAAAAGAAAAEDMSWMFRPVEQNQVDCSAAAPPVWCAEWRRLVGQNRVLTLPDPEHPDFGVPSGNPYPPPPTRRPPPPPPVPAEEWQEALRRLTGREYRADDLRRVRAMAEFGSADALEILGWMHANGVMVEKSAEMAYEFYGRAFLAGAAHVTANLNILWPQLSRTAQARLREMFDSTPR